MESLFIKIKIDKTDKIREKNEQNEKLKIKKIFRLQL